MKRSHVILLAVLVATLPMGYAGAAIINSSTPPEPSSVLAVGEEAGVRGTESIEKVTRDPINSASRGTGRDWAVTVFKARNGSTCAAPGRKVGNVVGSVGDKAGSPVEPYPIEEGASCADLRVTTALVAITESMAGDSPGTVVHGVAGPKVQSLTLTVKGVARDLALSPRRAFLAVLGPDVSITDVKVVATLKNGTREVLADPPPMG